MPEVLPKEIAAAATSYDMAAFCDRFDDPLLFVVRIVPDEAGKTLLEVLHATLEGARTSSVMPVAAMGFHTDVVRLEDLEGLPSSPPPMSMNASVSFIRWLAGGTHYVVRLRKRDGADSSYARRVSVGRATNKDIVLRHSTVSKFHAWFELTEEGEVYVADAGSKNGSKVCGKELFPREPTAVSAGDDVLFGSIEGMLCTPTDLWKALNR